MIGAHAALEYLDRIGLDEVEARQRELNLRVTHALAGQPRLRLLGPKDPRERPSIFAFALDGIDPHDAAVFLDEGYDVMVRSGMHCVHSFYERRGLPGNVRASFYFYNDRHDADTLVRGVEELLERLPGTRVSGTSAASPGSGHRPDSGQRRAAGSTGAAVRSARPRRRAARGRGASARGSG